MTAIANIVAYDGASTPVLHTFLPSSVTRIAGKVLAEWREAQTGVPVYAQPRISMSLEKLKSGVYKAEQRVVVPVMESIGSENSAGYTAAPKVAYENTVVTTGFFHERSDVTGRRLVRQLAVNVDGGIATSVTPVTSGPLPELFDLLVSPT
jgi:hypothetical protein